MKDLNVIQESIKILDENTGNTRFEHGHSKFLQGTSMKTKETKAKMNYCDFFKIRKFAQQRIQSTKLKTTFSMGKDICKRRIR